ncbi:MAG: Gfo/Idh/MocA family oxidoreductase [Pseudomonadota bacterium]
MINFGTLGTARITPRALLYPCMDEPGARVYAVAARDQERAEAFARHHQIAKVLDDYQALVDYPRIDALYNPLHIPAHKDWSIKALQNGKHVLCEKSIACNAAEATAMAEAADASGCVLMDAFHYRYHPVFIRAKEIYDSGELGDIINVDAAFHVPVTDPQDIRMVYALGGGVTMDIGCYPISWVRHITGAEPDEVSAQAEVGPDLVDVMLKTTMRLGEVTATTSGDMREGVAFTAYLSVTGSRGRLHVQNPIVPQNGHYLDVTVAGETRRESFDRRATYGYQLDAFLAAVREGASLYTDAWDGVKQMQVIDRAYAAAGLPLRGQSL